MFFRSLIVVIAFLTLLTNQVSAIDFDHLKVKSYNMEQGLGSAIINQMIRDSKGWLWVTTEDGFFKFDGYTFELVEGIDNPDTYSVIESSDYQIWVGSMSGINCYDPISRQVKTYPTNARVHCLFQDKNGTIWAGIESGELICIDPQTAEVVEFLDEFPNRNPNSSIYSITQLPSGLLYLATSGNGIEIFDPAASRFIRKKLFDTDRLNLGTGIAYDHNHNTIWYTSRDGLLYYNLTNDSQVEIVPLPDILEIVCSTVDLYGNVLIGTNGQGLWVRKVDGSWVQFSDDSDQLAVLTTDKVRSIYTGHQGEIWLGMFRGGINYLHEVLPFKRWPIPQNNNPHVSEASAVHITSTNNQLYGTDGAGLFYRPSTEVPFIHATHKSLDAKEIMSIEEDGEGNIWVGTYKDGLFVLWPGLNHFQAMEGYARADGSMREVRDITLDEDGMVWSCSRFDGISRLEPKSGEVVHYQLTASGNDNGKPLARCLTFHQSSGPLVGTNLGLYAFEQSSKTFHLIPQSVGLKFNDFESKHGVLWAGTGAGIVEIRRDSTGQIVLEYLPTELRYNALDVEIDDAGNIWAGTVNGLVKWESQLLTIKQYDEADGLPTGNFIFGGGAQANGIMLFGTTKGVVNFDPKHINATSTPPELAVSEIRMFGQPDQLRFKQWYATATLELKHDQNFFGFTVNSMDFASPSRNQFQFKLDGFDLDWSAPSNINHIDYTNVPPGQYQFLVKGSNHDGHWSDPWVCALVIIHKPWWLTWPAYLTYGILLLLALVVGRRMAIRTERLKAEIELEKFKADQTAEMNRRSLAFFSNVSHEIKTPITLILGPVRSLLGGNKKSEEQQRYLHIIERNAEQLSTLVSDVLLMKKIESGEIAPHFKTVDVQQLINGVVNAFRFEAEKNGVSLSLNIDATGLIKTDPILLERIVVNLVSNAIKYVDTGGHVWVNVGLNDQLKIEVKDDGPGISAKDQERIFERRVRLEDRSQKAEGHGIGLSYVKELVQALNGTIFVQSEVGTGSTFGVQLQVDRVANESTNKVPVDSNLPVLTLVEDDPELREFTSNELQSDFQIQTFSDGQQALEKIEQIQPELVLTDVMMPNMTGVELCAALKSNPNTSHLPVVLLTGLSGEAAKLEGLKAGADLYLTKPFDANVLKQQLANVLEQKQRLKKRFMLAPDLDHANLTANNVDQEFLQKLTNIVSEHLSEAEFGVKELEAALGMSKSILYPKVDQLTGLTLKKFIKTIRMKRAAELLLGTDATMSEIAYDVGYNYPKRFSKDFQEHFGATPTEYRKQ